MVDITTSLTKASSSVLTGWLLSCIKTILAPWLVDDAIVSVISLIFKPDSSLSKIIRDAGDESALSFNSAG